MSDDETTAESFCAIYVDMGTTNTRAWLMRGEKVLARGSRQVGVRDSAREQTKTRIQTSLKELIADLREQTNVIANSAQPVCVIGAGMIGSPLGIAEIAHTKAPAGLRELSNATRRFQFPEITTLPFLLVPGVRTGLDTAGFASLDTDDMMRGEETLCVGLYVLGLVAASGVLLNLGSHWKAIKLDAQGRVQSSVTSLCGEMIEAVRTQTILADSVGDKWPDSLSPEWIEAGMNEQRRSGLPRALFCVRLLAVKNQGTPADRFSFLLGAFLASDLDSLAARGVINGNTRVVISGHALIAEACAGALRSMAIDALVLTAEQTEKAFLTGLRSICALSAALRRSVESNPT